MSDDDPFKSTPEDKQAAMERMRALLAKRLTEGEILPMGFADGGDTKAPVGTEVPVVTRPMGGTAEPERKREGRGGSIEVNAGVSASAAAPPSRKPFEWAKRTVRFRPEHLLAFDAYCAATGRRHCDVLAEILAGFMATDEFTSVVGIQELDKS